MKAETPGWSWRYLDETGKEIGLSAAFPDRERAEAWMGGSWSGLRQQGVSEVVLLDPDEGSPVYRMSLSESQE